MSNRILDYPEATGITSDDYILLDNEGSGAKCIKASALNVNMDNYTIKEARGAIASFDDGEDLPLAFMGAYITAIQEGSGDPSPTNVRPIIGFSGVEVVRDGKNLFEHNSIAVYTYDFVSKNTFEDMVNPFFMKGGQTYVLTIDSENKLYRMRAFDKNHEIITDMSKINATSNGTDINYYDSGKFYGYGSSVANNITVFRPTEDMWFDSTTQTTASTQNMLELGSTPSQYEPYNGNTYSLTFTDGTNPLTVYGGYVDLISGVLTLNKLGINVMSQEKRGWQVGSKSVCYRITLPQTATSCTSNQTHGAISNMMTEQLAYYGVSRPNDLDSINFAIDTSGVALAVYDTDLTLSEQQMISKYTDLFAVYPLATPLTYQLSKQQIKSLVGVNNIFASTGDVIVDYRKRWVKPEM